MKWKLAMALASLLALPKSAAQAQGAPQEEGLIGDEPQSAPEPAADSAAPPEEDSGDGEDDAGGQHVRGTPASVGSIALTAGFRLGVGGGLETKGTTDDLLATRGIQFGGEYVLHQYFAVGGEFRAAWLKSHFQDQTDQPRFKLFDIVVKPRGRYVIEKIGLEVYGTMPLGLSIPSLPDVGNFHVDGRAGFTLGLGSGVIYMFTDMIGINGEMAAYWNWFRSVDGAGMRDHYTARQFNFIANVYVVL